MTSKLEMRLETCFLTRFGRKCDFIQEAGATENVVNKMVFVRFPVLLKFAFWVSFWRLWVSFWEVFGGPGNTFSDFSGCREQA